MRKNSKNFWKEWGMTRDEFLWFMIIPALTLLIFLLTIVVLILL